MTAPRPSTQGAIEIVRLAPARIDGLLAMLSEVERFDTAGHFAPHPFTRDCLASLCDPRRNDLYYLLAAGPSVLGYGLLRGWDEGFETPSLGIAIHPNARRAGYGLALMNFLHCAAHVRGARRVRLRVHASNAAAIDLYERLGYEFEPDENQATLRVAYKHLQK